MPLTTPIYLHSSVLAPHRQSTRRIQYSILFFPEGRLNTTMRSFVPTALLSIPLLLLVSAVPGSRAFVPFRASLSLPLAAQHKDIHRQGKKVHAPHVSWQLHSADGGGKEKESVAEPPRTPKRRWYPGKNFDKLLNKLFINADTNHDGTVSMEEIYELVLKMYINLNRQAPVPPPTRETVKALYRKADVDKSNSLDRYEFRKLMGMIYSRALFRITVAKISKVVFAPLLALETVQLASKNLWWTSNVVSKIPERYSMLLNPTLWRTVLTVFFVISLGNIILAILNAILDAVFGVKQKLEEADL